MRSALVGIWMGITPGGATPASFMSYGLAKKMSKDGAKFGTGQIEGVIAPETAAHAAGTSALLPMLALGIPGSPTAAVLLGGLLIWGLQPGPLLFVEQKDFVWGLIASMYLGNLVGLIVVLTTVPLFASILRIPFSIIAPVIMVICAIGAYTVHNAMLDIWLMMLFGVVGYLFKKLDYPLAPLVLALVLGDKAEDSFRQAMLLSQGEMSIFWSNPLVGSISTLAVRAAVLAAAVQADRQGPAAQAQGLCRRAAGRLTSTKHRECTMPVIAMTQEMGSLAKDIALQLAQECNLTVMRHEVLENVAGKMHVPTSLISRLREGKAGLVERLTTDTERVAVYTAEEVFALADKGNVVLRGWGATCLLRPVPHVVTVRITRSMQKARGVADGPPRDRRRDFAGSGDPPQRQRPRRTHPCAVRRDLGRPAALRPGAQHRAHVGRKLPWRRSGSWPGGRNSRRPRPRGRMLPTWHWPRRCAPR